MISLTAPEKPRGSELSSICAILRDRSIGWEACSSPTFTPGSFEEKAWKHNRLYPQHPLCLRRVYWAAEIEPRKRESGEEILHFFFDRIEPSLPTRDRLYEVEVEDCIWDGDEWVEEGMEMVRATSLRVEGAGDIFDPVDQVFGHKWLRDCIRGREEKKVLLIQEQLLKEENDDWSELFYPPFFGAREVTRPNHTVVELVQILEVEGEEKKKYLTIPKYSSY